MSTLCRHSTVEAGYDRFRAVVVAMLVAASSACGYDVHVNAPGQVTASTPGDSSHTSGDSSASGGFQRADLTVSVVTTGPDSAIAAETGVTTGRVPLAVVTIVRQGSSGTRLTDTADAGGLATFKKLVPGYYGISVLRLLSPSETAQLDSIDKDVSGFGGGGSVNVTAPSATASVAVAAGRRGSLIISEVFAAVPLAPGLQYGVYYFGQFIELYNNTDTTIYLDGKIIGFPQQTDRTYPPSSGWSCEQMAKWRDDPDGLWTHYFNAFPGTGHEYPLLPGHTAVVATDAIDHSAVVAGMPDLEGADFEFHGSNDVDNPAVPNMLEIGISELGAGLLGHGMFFGENDAYFIADAVDIATLPHDNLPVALPSYVRIPADKILDVFTTSYTPAGEALQIANGHALCGPIVPTNFDRQYASLYASNAIQSMARRVFSTLPDGRVILLRTKSSANDFGIAPPSPGVVGK